MAGNVSTPSQLRLALACGSTAWLEREPARQAFRLARFEASPDFGRRRSLPPLGAALAGFGPYPRWDANRMLRVASVPEAGGMMEGEHAFILVGQFLFLDAAGTLEALGPIRGAQWESLATVS
ncbi:MAG: hypothetical protein VKP57_12760 [Candidatus Sericytochromatia bacterium]|nr:hypothetical protein [Candidatus Sericytochromatia bacterium]